MTLVPNDIRNKEFESKFRGLDPEQVHGFLKEIAEEVETLQKENEKLTHSLKESQDRVAYFMDLKDALNQSIIVAQNAADRVKNNAQNEADSIKNEAENQSRQLLTEATERSNQILKDASERARHLTMETTDLKKETRVFHQRLQVLLESQIAMIKTPEWKSLLGQADENDEQMGDLLEGSLNNQPISIPESTIVESEQTTTSDIPDEVQYATETATSTAEDDDERVPIPDPEPIKSETPEDEGPVFQHRHADQQEETPTSLSDSDNYDGVTIVFPDDNE